LFSTANWMAPLVDSLLRSFLDPSLNTKWLTKNSKKVAYISPKWDFVSLNPPWIDFKMVAFFRYFDELFI
jgi:hypothetical protein